MNNNNNNDTRFDVSQFKIDSIVGNFHIIRVLGEGGMGTVFEARDIKLGRKVALKVMHPHIANISGAKEKFLREARTAASVEHDRIVRIYSVHDETDYPFITMELLQGESLHTYLSRQRIPSLGFTLQVGLHVAQGLQVAHSAGLIHRDIKPSNIWIEPHDGSSFRCKILDFGLARGGGADGAISHATNQGMGTPMYMSPEQWQGVGLDGRSDLFSLGVILYQMGSGQMPFEGETLPSIMFAVMQHEPQLIGTLNPGLPKGLAEIIMRLLAKDKNERPASGKAVAEVMADLLRDNERLLRDDPTADPHQRVPSPEIETQTDVSLPHGIFATRTDGSAANLPLPSFPSADSVDPPSLLQPPRKHATIGLVLGIVLLALVGGIFAFWPKGDKQVVEVPEGGNEQIHGAGGNGKTGENGQEVDPKKTNQQQTNQLAPSANGKAGTENKAGAVVPPSKEKLTFLDCTADPLKPEYVNWFQREYADQNGWKVNYFLKLDDNVSMTFVLIPPGKFWMGAVDAERKLLDQFAGQKGPPEHLDGPRHLVRITKPFYLGRFEVKRKEFARFKSAEEPGQGWDAKQKKFVLSSPDMRYSWKHPGWTSTDEHPAVNVSWTECAGFAEWAENLPTAKLPEGFKRVRLASEAQWEYACRAGSQSIFASGDDGTRLTELGNVADATLRAEAPSWPLSMPSSDKHAFTAPVGEYPENALGVCDLTGNVMEWCRDWYAPFPPTFPNTVNDPEGPAKGEEHAIRGGSFLGGILQQRISRRTEDAPEKRLLDLGFRLVIEP